MADRFAGWPESKNVLDLRDPKAALADRQRQSSEIEDLWREFKQLQQTRDALPPDDPRRQAVTDRLMQVMHIFAARGVGGPLPMTSDTMSGGVHSETMPAPPGWDDLFKGAPP